MEQTRTSFHQVKNEPKEEEEEDAVVDEVKEQVPAEIWDGPADKVVKEEEEEQGLVSVAASKIEPDVEEIPLHEEVMEDVEEEEEEEVPVCVAAAAAKVEPDEEVEEEAEEEEEEEAILVEYSSTEILDDGDSPQPVPRRRKAQASRVKSGKRKKVRRPRKQERKVGRPRKLNTDSQPQQEDYPNFKQNNVIFDKVVKEEEETITAEEEPIKVEEQVPFRVNAAKVKPDDEEIPVNLGKEEVQEEEEEQVPVRVAAAKVEPDEEEIRLPEEVPENLEKEEVQEEDEEPIIVEDDSCIEISDDDYSPSPPPRSRKAQASSVNSGKRKKVGRPRKQEAKVGRPRKLNTDSKPQQEDYPSFKLRVEPRHLTHNNVLVPYHMVRLNLPRRLKEVTLRVGSGEWKVRFHRFTSNKTGRMSVGWLEFAEDNSLEVDDVCVFRMVQSGVFHVSINDGDEYA